MTDFASRPYRPCAGIVLVNQGGLIFAGQRSDTQALSWQMPQGGIDKGETPRAAALRELREETGITPDLVAPLAKAHHWITYDLPPEFMGKAWGGKYRGQRQKWFLYRFTGRDDQIDIATDHPEFSAWSWRRADDLIAGIVPFKREAYREALAAFRAYLA